MENARSNPVEASARGGPTLVVVNSGSRSGSSAPADVVRALGAAGITPDELRASPDPSEIAAAVSAAATRGARRVIVGGGDGTISLVANLLAGTEIPLGVLPLGTGNDFARNLHLPRDLDRAARVIAAGRLRAVPVGVANGRVFVNALSFGLSSAVTQRLTPELKRRAGMLAYPVAAAAEAFSPKPFRLRVDSDGARIDDDALQVVVGNGRYHGAGTVVAPDAVLHDAELDVYIIGAAAGPEDDGIQARASNAWTLARVGMLLRHGRHLEHDRVRHFRCTRARFECEPPQEIDVDGEMSGQTPLTCDVRAHALNVIVP